MAKKKQIKKSRRKAQPLLFWITKDGRKLLPSQMSTAHLISTIRLCMWKARSDMMNDALDALAYASNAPMGAAYAAEGEATSLMNSREDASVQLTYARRHRPIVESMHKELCQRKLTATSVLL